MTSRSTKRSKSSARLASSLACSWIAPVLAASSTICSSSSFEMRASVKFVRSENGFSSRFEAAVRNQMMGLATRDSQAMGLATTSA
jgi:hypothetical protein